MAQIANKQGKEAAWKQRTVYILLDAPRTHKVVARQQRLIDRPIDPSCDYEWYCLVPFNFVKKIRNTKWYKYAKSGKKRVRLILFDNSDYDQLKKESRIED